MRLKTQPRRIELRGMSESKDQIALRGVRVRSRISGMSQKTTVEQMFVNRESRAIEAVYTFPLPDGAAVCGFEVITGDRVLTGTIEENEKAIEKYDDAIDEGHGAFMLEADRPDVFTARVGNLKPGQSATVRLTYVARLERVDKQIRIAFPTTIAPRYQASAGMDPLEAIIDGEALNPPVAMHVPYGLSLEMDVDLGQKITSIISPTHTVRVQPIDDGNASHRVLLAGAMTEMDRDIIIQIDLAKEQEPSAQVARGIDGAPYVAVNFVPEFEVDELAEPAPGETIFVLDCSGSMQGNSIEQATRALELCLRSLSPGEAFNIYRFGSTFQAMRSEPLVYSQQTLSSALEFVRSGADLGGTEILPVLESIFAQPICAGCSARNIVLLTDGQVTNEPAVVALARKHRDRNRIFSFGIGSAASSFLVKGLARATRGAAEFISGDERIEDKVLRTFSRMASPMIDDVQIDWGGADVQTLAEIPPIFDGDVLSIFGRVQGTPPPHMMLKCRVGGKERSWLVALPREHDDGGVISTMWARRTIQSLEEVNDVRRTSAIPRDGKRECQQIIDISTRFNIVSSLTTFIAIEHRSLEERNEGRPALRRVPVMLASGWGGLGDQLAGAAMLCCRVDATMDRSIDRLRALPRLSRKGGGLSKFLRGFAPARGRLETPSAPLAPAAAREDKAHDDLHRLLDLQSADGWFGWNKSLADRCAPGWKELESRTAEALSKHSAGSLSERSRVIHTVLVLVTLRERFADREASWKRAADKARRWITKDTGISAGAFENLLNELRSHGARKSP